MPSLDFRRAGRGQNLILTWHHLRFHRCGVRYILWRVWRVDLGANDWISSRKHILHCSTRLCFFALGEKSISCFDSIFWCFVALASLDFEWISVSRLFLQWWCVGRGLNSVVTRLHFGCSIPWVSLICVSHLVRGGWNVELTWLISLIVRCALGGWNVECSIEFDLISSKSDHFFAWDPVACRGVLRAETPRWSFHPKLTLALTGGGRGFFLDHCVSSLIVGLGRCFLDFLWSLLWSCFMVAWSEAMCWPRSESWILIDVDSTDFCWFVARVLLILAGGEAGIFVCRWLDVCVELLLHRLILLVTVRPRNLLDFRCFIAWLSLIDYWWDEDGISRWLGFILLDVCDFFCGRIAAVRVVFGCFIAGVVLLVLGWCAFVVGISCWWAWLCLIFGVFLVLHRYRVASFCLIRGVGLGENLVHKFGLILHDCCYRFAIAWLDLKRKRRRKSRSDLCLFCVIFAMFCYRVAWLIAVVLLVLLLYRLTCCGMVLQRIVFLIFVHYCCVSWCSAVVAGAFLDVGYFVAMVVSAEDVILLRLALVIVVVGAVLVLGDALREVRFL